MAQTLCIRTFDWHFYRILRAMDEQNNPITLTSNDYVLFVVIRSPALYRVCRSLFSMHQSHYMHHAYLDCWLFVACRVSKLWDCCAYPYPLKYGKSVYQMSIMSSYNHCYQILNAVVACFFFITGECTYRIFIVDIININN